MTSNQRYQTPARVLSSQSSHTDLFSQSSSVLVPSGTDRHVFSTPIPRHSTPGHPTSSNRGQSGSSNRANSGTRMHPYPSSPHLPSYPHNPRQRLSLRLPSSRASSNNSRRRPEDEDEDEDPHVDDVISNEDADALREIIMAVDMKENGNLGCAYYVAIDETLFLLEDVAMSGLELVETLLLHVNPTTILISARAPETLANYLSRRAQGVNGNQGKAPPEYRYALQTTK